MASTRLIVSLALLLTCSTASLPLLAGGSITNATLPSGKPGTVRLLANRVGSGKAMVVQNDTDVPIEAVLRLTRMVNVTGVGKGVIRKTVPARTRMRIATLHKRQDHHGRSLGGAGPHQSIPAGMEQRRPQNHKKHEK